jgi:hypothetical protein
MYMKAHIHTYIHTYIHIDAVYLKKKIEEVVRMYAFVYALCVCMYVRHEHTHVTKSPSLHTGSFQYTSINTRTRTHTHTHTHTDRMARRREPVSTHRRLRQTSKRPHHSRPHILRMRIRLYAASRTRVRHSAEIFVTAYRPGSQICAPVLPASACPQLQQH